MNIGKLWVADKGRSTQRSGKQEGNRSGNSFRSRKAWCQCSSTDVHPLSYWHLPKQFLTWDPDLHAAVTTSYVLLKQKHWEAFSGLNDNCPPQLLLASQVRIHATPRLSSLHVTWWFICSLGEGHLISLLNCCYKLLHKSLGVAGWSCQQLSARAVESSSALL